MDFPNEPLGNRITTTQIVRNQIDCFPIIRDLFGVVGLHAVGLLAREESFGLIEREVCAFDVRRVMRLEHQRPLLHSGDPILRKSGCIQKTTRAFNPGKIPGDGVGDPKFGL